LNCQESTANNNTGGFHYRNLITANGKLNAVVDFWPIAIG